MGEAYTLHDPDVCHSQIWSWPLFLSLHLTPEANIKCNRSQAYFEQAHTEVKGLPYRVGCRLTGTSLGKGNYGGRVSVAVSQEPEDWPYMNARLLWVERRCQRKKKNYNTKVSKTQVKACHCLSGRPLRLTSSKRKKILKELNFSVWPEKLDAQVGARASKL